MLGPQASPLHNSRHTQLRKSAGGDACGRAPESASGRRGESPLQANALRPVTECNCDAAMRGGEQQEVNDQSVG